MTIDPFTELESRSRRRFLAALAATGATVGFAGATTSPAHAASAEGVGTSTPDASSAAGLNAFPAPTPGTTYRTFLGAGFLPTGSASTYSKGFGEVQTNGVYFRSLADLPLGSLITELSFAFVKSAGFTGDMSAFLYRLTSGTINPLVTASTSTFGQATSEQYLNLTVPADVTVTAEEELWLVVNLSSSRLNSVRVGYVPPAVAPSFFPIAPKRVYDSRTVAPVGALARGASRNVSVANGYPDSSGTPDLPNVIPAGATAVAYNLTITDTTGSGYLSVNPGGATNPAGSSINWSSSNLILANGLVGLLGGDRLFTVFCGGSLDASTHFLIDVLGYYR